MINVSGMIGDIFMLLWPIVTRSHCGRRGTALADPLRTMIVGTHQALWLKANPAVSELQVLRLLGLFRI